MSLLSVEKLTLSVADQNGNKIYLVEDLSFSLEAHQSLGIVGESGSGKTLTALAICKLLSPEITQDSQKIQFLNQPLHQFTRKQMENILGKEIGFVFQEPMSSLNPLHTIGQQIEELLKKHTRLTASERRSEITALLHKVGLDSISYKRLPHTLSGGQRQRVMIAMAIACKPKLLILDEPTTALDVTIAKQILLLLKSLQQELGLAMIFISHDLKVIQFIADNVIVMQSGKVCEQGRTDDILKQPQHPYTQSLINSRPDGAAIRLTTTTPLMTIDALTVNLQKIRWFNRSQANIILHPVNLKLLKGESLGIVGESGSGKTTLALALLRLIQSAGSVIYLGKSVMDFNKTELIAFRKTAQIVFQDPMAALNPRMTIRDIIGEGLKVHYKSLTRTEYNLKISETLKEVGLDESCLERYPHAFSGGQRQRINLARALILKPKMIVLDEPTSALDLLLQKRMIALLKDLQAKYGLSYLFISHDLSVIKSMCHRVLVLKNGNIVEENTTQALFEAPQNAYTQALIESAFI